MSNPIGWCDTTWNPVTGCTPVSLACDHCYAERMSHRLAGRYGYPADEPFRVTVHSERLDQPLRWRKPRRVFVVSMGDLFHEDVPDEFLVAVFGAMFLAPQHVYQILTKRPKRMRDFLLNAPRWRNEPPANVWLGVTVENQYWADERTRILLDTPAAVRFISYEPGLGPLVLGRVKGNTYRPWLDEPSLGHPTRLDWVICGGETGPGARPADPAWFRSLRDQCAAAGVPFYLKDNPGTIDGVTYREFPGGGER